MHFSLRISKNIANFVWILSFCNATLQPIMPKYTTILFDLDGTLLDTLSDLAAATNHALRMHHLPQRTSDEVRTFVGNGVRKLMERAVPAGTDTALFEEVFATFRAYYLEHCHDFTCPYAGIMELVNALHAMGIKMGIVSNKWHTAVSPLSQQFFPGLMSVAIGESETTPRKPCPDGVLAAMHQLGVSKAETLYVGDSDIDLLTAQNAGVDCVSVLWGFRDESFLRAHGATHCIHTPNELLTLLA